MKIKTRELTGAALDWAVCKAEGDELAALNIEYPNQAKHYPTISPSTIWTQGGPIIEREEIGISRRAPCLEGEEWEARGSVTAKGAGYRWAKGPTPLIAAMRVFVASKLGDEVEVSAELLETK